MTSRVSRGAAVLLATVTLVAGVMVSGAKAAPPTCSSKLCSDDAAVLNPNLSGKAAKACSSAVVTDCKAGICFCNVPVTDPTSCALVLSPMPPPQCVTTTTTTTTSTTTSTTTTTTATTTTATTSTTTTTTTHATPSRATT